MLRKMFCILLIIASFCIVCIGSSNSINLSTEKNLSNNVKKYVDKSEGVEMVYADGDYIYGHFYDSMASNVVLETIGLFRYNIRTSSFKFHEYTEKKRIMTFYWLNDIIYYITLSEDENQYYWEFIEADENFNNINVLKSGKVENPLNYPRILHNNNSVYVISIDDIDEEKQIYQFYLVNDLDMLSLKQDIGSKNEKKGNLLYNIANVYIEDNIIFYTVVDDNNIQYLYSFNVENGEDIKLYENNNQERILYNYKIMDDGMYIQLASKTEDNKAFFIYLENKDKIINRKVDLKTFDIRLNTCIIFHNQTNEIEIFSEKKKKIYKRNVKQTDMYPKYLIINDKILMQDFKNQFYLSESLKKMCS